MKAEVTISIRFANGEVLVESNKGMKWRFEFVKPDLDYSLAGMVANITAAQLAGTITAQLLNMDEKNYQYKLELLTGADAR